MAIKYLDLSIIIISWNTADFLIKCLESLFRTIKRHTFEIIVVDNNSSDNSVKCVKSKFKTVRIIQNKKNIGFPKANNQAIELAKGKNILLLNPDTIVYDNTIDVSLDYINDRPDIGALGVKILNADGTIDYHCARRLSHPIRILFEIPFFQKIGLKRIFGSTSMSYWDHNNSRQVECISGAFMLIPKMIFDKLGLLDDTIFMYAEDTEMCFRINKNGYRIFYFADYSILHYGGQSSKKVGVISLVRVYEAYYYLFNKYYGTISALLWRILILLLSMARVLILLPSYCVCVFISKRNKRNPHNFIRHFCIMVWSVFGFEVAKKIIKKSN